MFISLCVCGRSSFTGWLMNTPRRVSCSSWGWSATPAVTTVPSRSTPSLPSGSCLMMPLWKRWVAWQNFILKTRAKKVYWTGSVSTTRSLYWLRRAPLITCRQPWGWWAFMAVKRRLMIPLTQSQFCCCSPTLPLHSAEVVMKRFTRPYTRESHRAAENAVLVARGFCCCYG